MNLDLELVARLTVTVEDEFLQPITKFLGQSEKLAFAHGNETAPGFPDLIQQGLEFHDLVLIDLQLPRERKPILLTGANVQIQLVDSGLPANSQLFPFRPFQDHPLFDLLDLKEHLQALFRVDQMPLPLVLLLKINGQVEHRTALFDLPRLLFLQPQVPFRPHPPAVNLGDDIGNSDARFLIRATMGEGPDKQLDPKATAIRDDVDMNGRVALHHFSGYTLPWHLDGRMDGHERGDVANSVQQLAAGG